MLRGLKMMLSLSLLLILASGCGSGGGSVSSYQPTGQSAKEALTTALDAWKSGREAPGTIANVKPALEVQDSVWGSGRKLKEFQIGDEQVSPGNPTRFKVKLTFADEPTTADVEYVVFGKDPIYVCHENDYKKMTGQ